MIDRHKRSWFYQITEQIITISPIKNLPNHRIILDFFSKLSKVFILKGIRHAKIQT
jgi:hypothetical protein